MQPSRALIALTTALLTTTACTNSASQDTATQGQATTPQLQSELAEPAAAPSPSTANTETATVDEASGNADEASGNADAVAESGIATTPDTAPKDDTDEAGSTEIDFSAPTDILSKYDTEQGRVEYRKQALENIVGPTTNISEAFNTIGLLPPLPTPDDASIIIAKSSMYRIRNGYLRHSSHLRFTSSTEYTAAGNLYHNALLDLGYEITELSDTRANSLQSWRADATIPDTEDLTSQRLLIFILELAEGGVEIIVDYNTADTFSGRLHLTTAWAEQIGVPIPEGAEFTGSNIEIDPFALLSDAPYEGTIGLGFAWDDKSEADLEAEIIELIQAHPDYTLIEDGYASWPQAEHAAGKLRFMTHSVPDGAEVTVSLVFDVTP